MGLAGRKIKQRIGNDPRNLSWADDAARFGSSYLSKFGWDSSKGLGAGGEGRTSHIKVAQKLDMLGIGAAHQKDPNGLAWKQNKDFENLLKRLNEANGGGDLEGEAGEAGVVVDGFVKPKREVGEVAKEEGGAKEKKDKRDKKKDRKEKKKDKDAEGEKKKKRKRDKESEDHEKKSKKKKKSDDQGSSDDTESVKPTESKPTSPEPTPAVEQRPSRVIPRHRSHRARHIAAKSLASKSAIAISEILGIAPTPSLSSSNTPSGTQTPQEGKLTSIYDDDDKDMEVDKITTSTKSLQDYFKEKMGKLKGPSSSAAVTSTQLETVGVDYDDVPRGGLGLRPRQVAEEQDDAPRIGLSKFSSLMSSSFMAATSLTSTFAAVKMEDPLPKEDEPPKAEKKDEDQEERRRRKKEKKEKKEQKRQEKEQKRQEKERKRQEDKEEHRRRKAERKGEREGLS